jgi:methionine-gamma-lyase
MRKIDPKMGMGSLSTHVGEGDNPYEAHVTPIYQTSTFGFPDVATGAAIFKGEKQGYIYTRMKNPNLDQLALKYAVLEGLDLLRQNPDVPVEKIVSGFVFSSGMAAITTSVMAKAKEGDTIIAQEALYGATYTFLHDMAPHFGIKVIFLKDPSPEKWQSAFRENPGACLAYIETPSNPTMAVVDIQTVVDIAHKVGAWVFVDNTFATPYCQRPLTFGTDVVMHSTTKYLSGHGQIVGGTVISRHVDYVNGPLYAMLKVLGGNDSPFEAWLANTGMKTFELRMQRHCSNAMKVAQYLEKHSAVEKVYYPGLESHPDHALARRQMIDFGGMLSFELKGGLAAGEAMMNRVKMMTLAVSLGNVDSLIQHPASMTHSSVPREIRLASGVSDGLVRLSVGIENVEDILEDLDQSLGK